MTSCIKGFLNNSQSSAKSWLAAPLAPELLLVVLGLAAAMRREPTRTGSSCVGLGVSDSWFRVQGLGLLARDLGFRRSWMGTGRPSQPCKTPSGKRCCHPRAGRRYPSLHTTFTMQEGLPA